MRRLALATIASTNHAIMVMVEPMQVAMKLEVITIPVSDIDRAKDFYERRLGWRLDADFEKDGIRAVQLTPPGSDCSIQFAQATSATPAGTAQRLYLVVPDIDTARADLVKRGVEVSEVFHYSEGPAPFGKKERGPAPRHESYGSYATFRDPDGNRWLLQEITSRFPGRVDRAAPAFGSASELASALRRAEAAHGEHEKRLGQRDADWPTWYASYIAAEQSGQELPR